MKGQLIRNWPPRKNPDVIYTWNQFPFCWGHRCSSMRAGSISPFLFLAFTSERLTGVPLSRRWENEGSFCHLWRFMVSLCWKDLTLRFVWKIMAEGVRWTHIQDGRNTTEQVREMMGMLRQRGRMLRDGTLGERQINRGRAHRGRRERQIQRARETSTNGVGKHTYRTHGVPAHTQIWREKHTQRYHKDAWRQTEDKDVDGGRDLLMKPLPANA